MLLRKLVVAVCPLLLCLLLCIVFRWLDGLMGSVAFFPYLLKGVLLGAGISLLLPLAGFTTRNNGLLRWLYVAAGVLLAMLAYQYLEILRVVHWPVLESLIPINGQVILVESTAMGFLLLSAVLNGRR